MELYYTFNTLKRKRAAAREELKMQITNDTKLKELLKEYPWLIDEAVKLDPAFRALRSPLARALIARADISEASRRTGIDTDTIIAEIEKMIAKHEG